MNEIKGIAWNSFESKVKPPLGEAVANACGEAIVRLDECILLLRERMLPIFRFRFEDFRERAAKLEQNCFVRLFRGKKGQNTQHHYNLLVPADKFSAKDRIKLVLRVPLDEEMDAEIREAIERAFHYGRQKGTTALNQEALEKCRAARDFIRSALLDECHFPGPLRRELATNYHQKVERCLEEAIRIVEVDKDFVENHFSILKVVEYSSEKYQRAYTTVGRRERSELREQVNRLFGYDLESREIPRREDCYASLAAHIALSCQPFMEWIPDQEDPANNNRYECVGIWLPSLDIPEDSLKGKIQNCQSAKAADLRAEEGARREMKIYYETKGINPFYNPFTIVTMSYRSFPNWDSKESENFGGVTSVDYWREDPRVKELLEAAEVRDPAKNLATGGGKNLPKSGGIGYIDPRFVMDARWRSLRWRPWAQADIEMETVDARAAVLSYICTGNLNPDEEGSSEMVRGVLRRLNSEKNWKLPLLKRTPSGSWRWQRKLYVAHPQNEALHEDATQGNQFKWKVKEPISSLAKVVKFVQGMDYEEIRGLDWEIQRFREHLTNMELRSDEIAALQESARQFLNWLIENDAQKNYTGRPKDAERYEAFLQSARKAVLSIYSRVK